MNNVIEWFWGQNSIEYNGMPVCVLGFICVCILCVMFLIVFCWTIGIVCSCIVKQIRKKSKRKKH